MCWWIHFSNVSWMSFFLFTHCVNVSCVLFMTGGSSWEEVVWVSRTSKTNMNWRRRCSIIGSSVKPFWFSGSYMNFLDDMQRVVWFERHLERIENGMIMTFIALFKEFPSTFSLIKVNTFAIIYSCHRTMYNRKHATTVRKYKKIHSRK